MMLRLVLPTPPSLLLTAAFASPKPLLADTEKPGPLSSGAIALTRGELLYADRVRSSSIAGGICRRRRSGTRTARRPAVELIRGDA